MYADCIAMVSHLVVEANIPNQHLSWNFCARDTSVRGYLPDPPSLSSPFNYVGGSGHETNATQEFVKLTCGLTDMLIDPCKHCLTQLHLCDAFKYLMYNRLLKVFVARMNAHAGTFS